MLPLVVVAVLIAVAVGAIYTVVDAYFKARTGTSLIEKWLMKIYSLQLHPVFLADRRGSMQIISLIIALVAAGLIIMLGIGMFSEAQNTISPPTGNPDAELAYNKTVSTVWKSFQLTPLALLATVFGVIIGAVVGGFAFLTRRD
ncbi:hypothetical protein [Archaeoglobus profundus]|uniref:Uncharacterized protein n=1 Tax=Archaeoglobus profundus (strain DSM 5631 / JCM 9629 / NBRC 100127 / Av18) TaxID=572546 RepID=D2RI36_ARCPA|nr:hypothetical protein [Archaeoglobus profundus]ADB57961.1 hypothetical protein Arcpr_0900 [Archaeoglobus profundus DSM 5631]